MPALLLIGIPVAVVILFMGIMSLPDEEVKKDSETVTLTSKPKKKKK